MSQYNWTYVGGGGRNFRVSLFHGDKTGHVLILLNGRILLIDFNIRQSKTYSFFIEEEFCEVRLERRGEEMYYFFEINKKVDTPLNRDRRKQNRRYLGQTLAFFSLLLLVSIVSALGFRAYNKKLDRQRMDATAYTDSARAWVQLDTLSKTGSFYYYYVAGTTSYSQYYFVDSDSPLPGFPLQSGDEFIVHYHPRRPDLSRISFSQPTEEQVEKYIDRTLSRHLALHPGEYPPQARCTLELAFELRGLPGLADFFFQTELPETNPSHNKEAYLRLMRDPAFQQALANRCWN